MTTIIILFSCIIAGFLLRNAKVPQIPSRVTTVLVWALLFFFGITIGGNREIIEKIRHYGVIAIIIGFAATAGSAIAAAIFYRLTRGKEGKIQ